jgi:hypothetical protein
MFSLFLLIDMDRFDRSHVKAEAWLNRNIFRMTDEANKKDLLKTFSGASPRTDREFQQYILTLFPS